MSNTIEFIQQGNELIATFLGKTIVGGWVQLNDAYNGEYHVSLLNYDKSWNDLMPVVEKIETLVIKTNITSNCVIIRVNEDELNTDDVVVSYKGIMSKIEAVWQAVVQFIEWYNNQKSNK